MIRDLSGQRFGKLTALRVDGRCYNNVARWLCRCDCGVEKHVASSCLVAGSTRSCGCARDSAEVGVRRTSHLIKHGMAHHPTYNNWRGIMKRCFETAHDSYPRYGGVGIKPCPFIAESPANLLASIGPKPSVRHSVDRLVGTRGYWCGECPDCRHHARAKNIRWATKSEQSRNMRSNRLITINGVAKCVAAWADEAGIDQDVIYSRLKQGWDGPRLLSRLSQCHRSGKLVRSCPQPTI